MGWPPAVVIVVRHGARLDAADNQWHLTSPTPYDPPLTYGGWTQSRALGARIASILRTRETDDEALADGKGKGETRKRRHKVIIHTSPFLRCIQTAVAISSGLAQNPGHLLTRRPSSSQSQTQGQNHTHKPSNLYSSPKIRPMISTSSPRLAPIREPTPPIANSNGKPVEQPENIKKSTIRVDAFLGEWLSPDYFEFITPPPSSIMMVTGAKAELLRREDHSSLIHHRDHSGFSMNQSLPGLWGSPTLAEKREDEDFFPSMSNLGHALMRDRTSSMSSAGSSGSRLGGKSVSLTAAAEHGVYQPPIPSYAVSISDPIPAGYVTHARDACVDVDYQWDSMREPQNWGHGGDYGEEWSSMHKRFRKGLSSMIDWYSNSDDPGGLVTRAPTNHQFSIDGDVSSDEDTDLVLILVSHGAGCNALIGALTNQPVLLDVAMASLTMAVRKPDSTTLGSTPSTTPKTHSRRSSRNIIVADEYDVKLVANTEHLRSSTSTPSTSRHASIANLTAFKERYNVEPGRSMTTNQIPGSFGSIRRTASVAGSANSASRSYVPVRQTSIGLWSATPPPVEEPIEEDNMILNFGEDSTADKRQREESTVEAEKNGENEDTTPIAPLGLWGSPRPPGEAERTREIAPKRRWTVNERG